MYIIASNNALFNIKYPIRFTNDTILIESEIPAVPLFHILQKRTMSFIGRALGQFVSRWMTDKVANSPAMRKTAKVAVRGVKDFKGTAKAVQIILLFIYDIGWRKGGRSC